MALHALPAVALAAGASDGLRVCRRAAIMAPGALEMQRVAALALEAADFARERRPQLGRNRHLEP